jgi:hypothetical protein
LKGWVWLRVATEEAEIIGIEATELNNQGKRKTDPLFPQSLEATPPGSTGEKEKESLNTGR